MLKKKVGESKKKKLKALVSKLSINVEEEMTTSQTDRYKRHPKAPDLRCRQWIERLETFYLFFFIESLFFLLF